MLSKEKIQKEANIYYRRTPSYVDQEKNFTTGAEWASKQYAGVVKELKGLIKRWNQSELTMEYLEETFPTLEEELNKLKQP